MLYQTEANGFGIGSIDTEKINYASVWDTLGLSKNERKLADRVIQLFHSCSPDLKNADHYKPRQELERAGNGVVDRLISEGILERHLKSVRLDTTTHPQTVYGLNPKTLHKLERKY